MSDSQTRLCSACGKEAALKCSRCLRVTYCDAKCQGSDWKVHKKICFPEGSTCTRCLQVISINTICSVPHPAHLVQDQGSMFGGDCTWNFSCQACNKSFAKTSKNYNGLATAPITTGAKFCFEGMHIIKPLPESDQRRIHHSSLMLYSGPDLQEQINNIPAAMSDVEFLVIKSAGCYNESSKPSLEISMPKLKSLKLIDVAFSKITLNAELTPSVEELFMQNIPDECELTVELLELKSLCIYYYGPVDNEKWFHDMLGTAKKLRTFDSYKLRISPKISFAGNDLESIRLGRAECLCDLSIYAPNLQNLSLQGCFDLADGGVTFLNSHPNFTRPPGKGSTFIVDTTNACLNKAIVHTLTSNPRVVWSGEGDEDDW